MQTTNSTLAERIKEAAGTDNGREIAKQLSLAGEPVSPQSVYNWLKGEHGVSDENIAALARVYKVDEAWLKYGTGAKRQLTNGDAAVADLFSEMPTEEAQLALDFIEYRLHRSTLIASENLGQYMTWIDRVKADLARRSQKGKPPDKP